MSLDVYLKEKAADHDCWCAHCGVVHKRINAELIYSANITHNLATMAEKAGIYMHLWRPEEIGITTAAQLIEPLERGIEKLREHPKHFKQFSASNGWGTYDQFIPWVEEYLRACRDNPDSLISVSR